MLCCACLVIHNLLHGVYLHWNLQDQDVFCGRRPHPVCGAVVLEKVTVRKMRKRSEERERERKRMTYTII